MSDENEQLPLWIHWPLAIMASLVGIGFAISIGTSTAAQLSTENWENTTGIVEEYEVYCIDDSEGGCAYEEDIVYAYNIDGWGYTGTEISLGWTTPDYGTYDSYFNYDGIRIGDEIDVFYNPENPRDSVLLIGWDGIDIGDFIILGFTTIIPLTLLITARIKGKLSDAINEFNEFTNRVNDVGNKSRMNRNQWNYQNNFNHKQENQNIHGISSSRIRGYNSVISRLSLNEHMDELSVKNILQTTFELEQKDAQRFIDSPYVRSILFSDSINTTLEIKPPLQPLPPITEKTTPNFDVQIQTDSQNNDLQNALLSNFQAAMEKGMNETKIQTENNLDLCSHSECNNTVTFYSFQCFSCRKKFCDEHRGSSIHCPECSN